MTKRTTKNLSGTVLSQESFTYDKSSNLTQANGTAFTYDAGNRLTSYNGNTLTYDADGNMLSDGSMVYEYDSANRLTKAGGNEYTYNAEDVRIRNLCGEYDTTYVYDTVVKLSRMLMKTTNGIVTKYVYGHGLIGEEKECNVFKVYHFDYRGSTVAITDMYGNVTDRFEYDTYGKMVSHVGDSFVIFGYNGRDGVVTDKNGLLYMRARYYNPTLCRFVNADIIHGEISHGVTLNRYAYANGNPVSFVDPFGLSAERTSGGVSQKKANKFVATLSNGWNRVKKFGKNAWNYWLSQRKTEWDDFNLFMNTLYYSIEFDLGIGGGFGVAVDVCDFEVTALIRGDILAIQKSSGAHPEFGQAGAAVAGISSPGVFLGQGEEQFDSFAAGKDMVTTVKEPSLDLSVGVGASIYLFGGATAYIGIDLEYFIENYYGLEIQ